MPLVQRAVQALTKPLPNVISPRTHLVADYLIAGAFLATAAGFWRINKRAGLGALICGAADLLIASLTTRPGGARRPLGFRTHGRIDMGLAAMTATMPDFMGIGNSPQAQFFLLNSIVMTVIAGMTDFDAYVMDSRRRGVTGRFAAPAA